jgi:hypothetical protein
MDPSDGHVEHAIIGICQLPFNRHVRCRPARCIPPAVVPIESPARLPGGLLASNSEAPLYGEGGQKEAGKDKENGSNAHWVI